VFVKPVLIVVQLVSRKAGLVERNTPLPVPAKRFEPFTARLNISVRQAGIDGGPACVPQGGIGGKKHAAAISSRKKIRAAHGKASNNAPVGSIGLNPLRLEALCSKQDNGSEESKQAFHVCASLVEVRELL
jgi:hypothetical protein